MEIMCYFEAEPFWFVARHRQLQLFTNAATSVTAAATAAAGACHTRSTSACSSLMRHSQLFLLIFLLLV